MFGVVSPCNFYHAFEVITIVKLLSSAKKINTYFGLLQSNDSIVAKQDHLCTYLLIQMQGSI